MEGADLDAKLSRDSYIEQYHRGSSRSDEDWPVPWNLPAGYIFNMDSPEGPGQHWICFFIDSDSYVDYMDSYSTPSIQSMYKWLKHGFGPVKFNRIWLQHPLSTIYWSYFIYFLATHSQGLQLKDILKHYHSFNFRWNECLIMPLIWHGVPNANPRLPSPGIPAPLQVSMMWRDLPWPPLLSQIFLDMHTYPQGLQPSPSVIDIMASPLVGTSSDMMKKISLYCRHLYMNVSWFWSGAIIHIWERQPGGGFTRKRIAFT